MELNLMDVEKFVKVNPTTVKEVTNPVFLDRDHTPTYDGLLSTDIFGATTRERSKKFAFIRLGGYYFQPIVYKNLKRLDRRIEAIVQGKMKVIIKKDGSLEEDPNGFTGLEFLYKNWEKIKFKKNGSSRDERVDLFLNHKKNELFTNVWIVCPALYRDVNLQNMDTRKLAVDTVNNLYSRLIRLASMLRQDSSFVPTMNNTRFMIQKTLVDIYDYFKDKVQKKYGIFRRNLLGKTMDYGARLVISAPNYNYNSYKDTDISFFKAGVPLANCCNLFTPFILRSVRRLLEDQIELFQSKKKTTDDKFIPLSDPMSYYNADMIKKMMDTFIYSFSGRFGKIEVPYEGMNKKPLFLFFTIEVEGEEPITRPLTLTDLFFMAAVDVCKDKHIYITRYPMTDFMGTFPIGISVMSTHQTCKATVNGTYYEKYPIVDLTLPPEDVANQFLDTLRFPNVYLTAMNGDYKLSIVVPYNKNLLNCGDVLSSPMYSHRMHSKCNDLELSNKHWNRENPQPSPVMGRFNDYPLAS